MYSERGPGQSRAEYTCVDQRCIARSIQSQLRRSTPSYGCRGPLADRRPSRDQVLVHCLDSLAPERTCTRAAAYHRESQCPRGLACMQLTLLVQSLSLGRAPVHAALAVRRLLSEALERVGGALHPLDESTPHQDDSQSMWWDRKFEPATAEMCVLWRSHRTGSA